MLLCVNFGNKLLKHRLNVLIWIFIGPNVTYIELQNLLSCGFSFFFRKCLCIAMQKVSSYRKLGFTESFQTCQFLNYYCYRCLKKFQHSWDHWTQVKWHLVSSNPQDGPPDCTSHWVQVSFVELSDLNWKVKSQLLIGH